MPFSAFSFLGVPMKIRPIYDPEKKGRAMRAAAFMSGSGTNVIRLLERERELEDEPGGSPFRVIFIFSDRSDGKSAGEKIALDRGIPYFSYDIRRFHKLRGLKRTTFSPEGIRTRRKFDSVACWYNHIWIFQPNYQLLHYQ